MTQQLLRKIAPFYENKALVLDDNDGNRMLLKFVIEGSKVEYCEAVTARAALAMWKPGAFSFAFLDIELPDINGLEVARQMRNDDDGVAIIMCSTNDDPRTISEAVSAGCDMFLVKPFSLDIVMNLVKLVNRANLRAEAKVLIIDNRGRYRWEPKPRFHAGEQPANPTA